ncbi:MAG: crossover junction endodeoxyribonuclease RuvC [Patescibacteria group bacterium]
MKVLGIDPGYERLGVAIVEKTAGREKLLFSDCFRTSSKKEMPNRILEIGNYLKKLIGEWKPEILAIEKLFFTTNQKTAMNVAETKGAITYIAKNAGLTLQEFTPLQIKIAITGYGKADKGHVSSMVKNLIDIKKNLPAGRQEQKILDDEYDAIAVALTCIASTRY